MMRPVVLPCFVLCLCICSFVALSPTTAQTQTPDKNYRRVFWLHDINEDDLTSSVNAPQSSFWRNYAGESRIATELFNPCPANNIGMGFFPDNYKMNASLLQYYTDRPIPVGNYAVFDNAGTRLNRDKLNNSQPATTVANSLHSTILDVPIGEQATPFVIAQGTGALLALDIHRRFPTHNLFGGIISIGGAYQGVPLIKAASDGKLDKFDAAMTKALKAGYEKFAQKVDAKIFSTALGLGFGFIPIGSGGVAGEAAKKSKDLLMKIFEKLLSKTVGFISSEFLKLAVQFEGNIIAPIIYPELPGLLTNPPPYDPKIFNQYIKAAYTKTNRPLLADFSPESSFVQQLQNHEATIPIVSINGRAPKASYFQIMQTARWNLHTKNRCLDLKVNMTVPVDPYDPEPTHFETQAVDISQNHEMLGEQTKQAYQYAIQHQAEQFKSKYIYLSSICETIKFAQSAIMGQVPGAIAGGVFGVIGMFQAVEAGDEIKAGFEKSEKWVKNEADASWAFVIGASYDNFVTEQRVIFPGGAIAGTDEQIGNNDFQIVDVQINYPLTFPHDGIVGAETQESPQERGWRGGNSVSGLNLEANKVDHFSQANHPVVKRQIEATIDGTSSNLQNVQDAFRVRKQ